MKFQILITKEMIQIRHNLPVPVISIVFPGPIKDASISYLALEITWFD